MGMKKITKKYYFSVEGETEQWYLKWLEQAINNNTDAIYKVQLISQVEKNPLRFVKRISNLTKTTITHVFDFEEPNNQPFIEGKLSEMRAAERLGKGIKYELGYSNLMFELWMILHKTACNGIVNDKGQYLQKINAAYETTFESLKQYKEKDNFKKILSKLSLDDVIGAVKRAENLMTQKSKVENARQYRNYKYYLDNPALSIGEKVGAILQECRIQLS